MATIQEQRAAILRTFIARATAQHMAGARRDSNAVEFLVGAMATCEAIGNKELSHAVSLATFFVSARGYRELVRIAEETPEGATP